MYTNTSNVKAIAGLIFVTFATTAVVLYTPQIVEGIVTLTKRGKEVKKKRIQIPIWKREAFPQPVVAST